MMHAAPIWPDADHEDPVRLYWESKWMRCPHPLWVKPYDLFIRAVEVCGYCRMPRPLPVTPGAITGTDGERALGLTPGKRICAHINVRVVSRFGVKDITYDLEHHYE